MSLDLHSSDRSAAADQSAPAGRRAHRRALLASFAAVAIMVVGAFAVTHHDESNAAVETSTAIDAAQLADQYGVRIDVVGLIASGGLVELKFQVLDADKAMSLFGEVDDMPKLAVEDSTRVLTSAKGMKHHLTLLDGAEYFFLYTNVANSVHAGTQLAFVVNGVRLPHLVVQQ